MRVFVVGATGVIGRALLPQLTAAGHTVIGLARSPEKLVLVDRLGAKAARGDVLDSDAMRRLLSEQKPEAVVNLATVTPLKLKINPKDWEANDRVRVEGTSSLLAAAQEAGTRLFVQESVGYVCQSQGAGWISEESPLTDHPFLRATRQMEEMVRASSLPATLLRFGALTSADSWHTQQSIAALRRGMLPVIGEGASYLSLIHTQDAAQAILRALADPHAAQGQTFNVADSEPATMGEVFPYAAKQFHAPAPKHIAPFLAKMVVGALTLEILLTSYRMSNAKIRQTLNFTPRYPTYRETWTQIAQEVGGGDFAPSPDLQ